MTAARPPARHAFLQILTLFGLFAAGGFIGLGLAAWCAPGSDVAAAISGLLLPSAFVIGLLFWAGLDLVVAIVNVIRGRRRQPHRDLAPHAARWFAPVATILAGAGGLITGFLPGGRGVLVTTAVYAAAGAAFGFLTGRLAAAGYLPGPHVD